MELTVSRLELILRTLDALAGCEAGLNGVRQLISMSDGMTTQDWYQLSRLREDIRQRIERAKAEEALKEV